MFRVAIDGRWIEPSEWRHGSAERLLKLLLITPRHRMRREAAAELLWPGLPPGRGAVNLRRAHHFLGRALEPEARGRVLLRESAIVGLRPEIRLESDLQRLITELARLDRALLLDQAHANASTIDLVTAIDSVLQVGSGEILPDDGHEEWLVPHREHLLIRWEEVLLSAATAFARRGEPMRAAALVRHVLATDPADEDAHRLAIHLYARGGHHHAARRQLEVCRRALREAYGLDPSPSTFAALTVDPA
ncbi:MAG: AfsR/SARP family transcriptional regulator [Candidatus Limnocylindria bacterium]